MFGVIDNYNFGEMEPQRYFAPPASWPLEKKKTETNNRIFGGEFLGAEKKDGYFSQFVKDEDGNMFLMSRSRGVDGTFPNKIEWVPHLQPFFDELPNGTCLLGELYLPSKPGSRNITTILGCLKDKAIKRQEKEKLHFYVFDVLADEGKNWINTPAEVRFDALNKYLKTYNYDCVEFAKYVSGKELWNLLQTTLAEGGEGVVITHKDAKYEPGKRPSKTTMKVKKELQDTVDCFFTGRAAAPTKLYSGKDIINWKYWINEVTDERLEEKEHYAEMQFEGKPYVPVTKPYYYHWAGSLEIGVMKNKEVYPIGYISGLTDEIKAHYKDYKHRCIEVAAMERFEDTMALRHAKMIGFRDDLTAADCTWEKYIGEH